QTIFTVPGTHDDAACEADADPGTLLVLAGLPPRNSEARPLPIWCQIPRNSRLMLLRNSALARSPQALVPAAIRFCRRRCTEDGMRRASRYLATVRRAMSTPSSFKRSTILSSDNTPLGGSASIISLMRWRTASDECASPSPAAAIAEVKKY